MSIVIYIAYAKIFICCKKRTGTLDPEDPFTKIILDNNKDFIEDENFFMITQTLQIVNLTISLGAEFMLDVEKSETADPQKVDRIRYAKWHIQYIQIPFEILLLFVWSYLFWKGTAFEKLFSKRNWIILGSLSVLDFIIHAFGLYDALLISGEAYKDEITMVLLCSLLNQLSVYVRYILVNRDFKKQDGFAEDFVVRKYTFMSSSTYDHMQQANGVDF